MPKHQDSQMFSVKLKNISNVQPLEVVGRCSEKQLQVVLNLNYLIQQDTS